MMTKFQLLLLILMVAFAATACAAVNEQNTTVSPAADQQPAPSPETPATDPQDPTSISGDNSAPIEVPATETPDLAPLPIIGPAPGWSNETWINTDTPLPLEDLRGKVVLLEFWTFG